MALFKLLWLRRFVRKNTNPIPINQAEKWKKRLSFTYMILGWNAFGLVCYMCYAGKSDWARYYGLKSEAEVNMPAGQAWAQTLGIEKVKVYRFSGFQSKGQYMVEGGEIKKETPSEAT